MGGRGFSFGVGWLGHGKFAKLSGFLDEELFSFMCRLPFWVTGRMGGELNKGVFTSPWFLLAVSKLFLPGCDVMLGCLPWMDVILLWYFDPCPGHLPTFSPSPVWLMEARPGGKTRTYLVCVYNTGTIETYILILQNQEIQLVLPLCSSWQTRRSSRIQQQPILSSSTLQPRFGCKRKGGTFEILAKAISTRAGV